MSTLPKISKKRLKKVQKHLVAMLNRYIFALAIKNCVSSLKSIGEVPEWPKGTVC